MTGELKLEEERLVQRLAELEPEAADPVGGALRRTAQVPGLRLRAHHHFPTLSACERYAPC